jgi:hypothetical protein
LVRLNVTVTPLSLEILDEIHFILQSNDQGQKQPMVHVRTSVYIYYKGNI